MTPLLTLPRLDACVPCTITSRDHAVANAQLCRYLIDAGVVREAYIPADNTDLLHLCDQAIGAWIRDQIGPLQCLQPRFAACVLDAGGYIPVQHSGRQAPYAQLDLYWCEYQEAEWPVGDRLEALNAAMPNLGRTVLQVLRQQCRHVYPLFTPDIAADVASCLYWQCEADEEAALDMLCDEDTTADREALRADMVTRAMLDAAYPNWVWRSSPGQCAKERSDCPPAWRPCNLRRAARTLADPALRQIATDALALSRLSLDNSFSPECDGEYIGYGAVLSWREGDLTTRIYDDLLNQAHRAEFCDRMGEQRVALDDPGALGAWFARMGQRLQAIGLIDRVVHGLTA
jgi:PRTRC genetic system protein F